ncbi:MAG: DUF6788 family protein [Polyangia bacterium]
MQAKKIAPATKTITLRVTLPLLPGCVSTARSTCGKPNCRCKAQPPKLHGPYFRWTGLLAGKPTTKTLTPAEARECRRRIAHYRSLEKQIRQLVRHALKDAPWHQR